MPCANYHVRAALCAVLRWLAAPLLKPLLPRAAQLGHKLPDADSGVGRGQTECAGGRSVFVVSVE